MSYILDALKKAEHERTIGQVPSIGSEYEAVLRRGPGPWMWVLIVVLLFNAVLLVVLLWPEPEPATARVVGEPMAARPVPAQPQVSAPVAGVPARTPATTAPPQALRDPVAASPVRPPVVPLRPLPPLPEPEVSKPVETASMRGALPVPQSAAPATYDNNLPVWPQISGQLLGALKAPLHLDVHVYSENPAERFVLINMRKYRTGELLQEGPSVDEITPDSVILSFQGQRFRMQSQ